MARLIDADVVPKLFEKKYVETEKRIFDGEAYLDTLAEGFTEADDVILSMPTVDAVPVVRCRECGYWNHREDGYGDCSHPRFHLEGHPDPTMTANDFCSAGKRRDEHGEK